MTKTNQPDNAIYEVITKIDPVTGDTIIPIPTEVLLSIGWNEGDEIDIATDDEGRMVLVKRGGI